MKETKVSKRKLNSEESVAAATKTNDSSSLKPIDSLVEAPSKNDLELDTSDEEVNLTLII